MPFNTRLDRVIGFIQREHDKAAAEADARRPHRTRHHDLLLIEDAPVRFVCLSSMETADARPQGTTNLPKNHESSFEIFSRRPWTTRTRTTGARGVSTSSTPSPRGRCRPTGAWCVDV